MFQNYSPTKTLPSLYLAIFERRYRFQTMILNVSMFNFLGVHLLEKSYEIVQTRQAVLRLVAEHSLRRKDGVGGFNFSVWRDESLCFFSLIFSKLLCGPGFFFFHILCFKFQSFEVFPSSFFTAFYLSFSFQLYLVGLWEKSILVIAVGFVSRQDLDGDGQLSMAEFWEGDMAAGGEMMLLLTCNLPC